MTARLNKESYSFLVAFLSYILSLLSCQIFVLVNKMLKKRRKTNRELTNLDVISTVSSHVKVRSDHVSYYCFVQGFLPYGRGNVQDYDWQ